LSSIAASELKRIKDDNKQKKMIVGSVIIATAATIFIVLVGYIRNR
jgi:multisubunit Na+/H+ antiporter MnhC subunit